MGKVRGIYKRGNIYWITYMGIDGRIVRESEKSQKKSDAITLYIERKKAVSDGESLPIKKIRNFTFNELSVEYLCWAERQRSFRSKKGFIRQLEQAFNGLPLKMFNALLVETYQTEKIKKGNKPATINRHIATLKHMIRKAVDWKMAPEEILKNIRKVKLLEENNRRLKYLSAEQIQLLLSHCDDHLKPIVTVAVFTGMRKGEILGLRWENVDLKKRLILLDKTKNGERREIPINGTLRETIEDLFQGSKDRPRRLDVPWVFYDPRHLKPYKDIKRSFNTAVKKAGIRDFVFHDLRHTFASHLVMAGVDLTTVKELLGHKTLTMTLRYAHLADAHKVNAVELLNKAFKIGMDCEVVGSQLLHNLEG